MRAASTQKLPLARSEQLVVQELPDEVLVYDLDRHQAHCLNKTSALIWKHCDGETTVEEVSRLLTEESMAAIDDDVVWLALSQLRRFHLLEEESRGIAGLRVTRRDLVRKYLPAALVLPLIISVASPAAAQAASNCGTTGAQCGGVNPPCCTGFGCNPGTGTCFPT